MLEYARDVCSIGGKRFWKLYRKVKSKKEKIRVENQDRTLRVDF